MPSMVLPGMGDDVDGALDGRGGLVMLAGQLGIGKTRLTEELSAVAHDRGAVVTLGVCYEGGGTPPYWPWIQAIRSLLTEPSEAIKGALETRAAVIAEIVPEIRDILPQLESAPEVDPSQARFRLFDSVTSFLNGIAIVQPVVVVLDDLHWANLATFDLLEFVSREVATRQMLIIGGYRDIELSRGHPLAKSLATLARARGFQLVFLRGLGSDEVGHMVEAVGDIVSFCAGRGNLPSHGRKSLLRWGGDLRSGERGRRARWRFRCAEVQDSRRSAGSCGYSSGSPVGRMQPGSPYRRSHREGVRLCTSRDVES